MTDLIRSACLTSYPDLARSLGLDPERMLDAVGIDPRCLEDPDIRVPAGAIGRLLEVSAKAAGVEDFGLRLAETRTLSILGPIGLLVREEPTLRAALRSLIRYIGLHNEALEVRLAERDGEATIAVGLRRRGRTEARQGVELTVGVLYRVLASLAGADWRPSIRFEHAAPRRREAHRRLFGGRVSFGQPFTGIVCDARALDRAIPTSDAALARYARQHLEAMLHRPEAGMAVRVRELLVLQIGTGRCSADSVAAQFDVDRRTLHRRLAAEGTTYSALLGSVRDELVAKALPRADAPLGQVADALGFASLSAFSRWFRTHYRATASEWRRR